MAGKRKRNAAGSTNGPRGDVLRVLGVLKVATVDQMQRLIAPHLTFRHTDKEQPLQAEAGPHLIREGPDRRCSHALTALGPDCTATPLLLRLMASRLVNRRRCPGRRPGHEADQGCIPRGAGPGYDRCHCR